jgi:hypothetical protein
MKGLCFRPGAVALTLMLAGMLAAAAGQAAPEAIRLGSRESLPNVGIKFRGIKDGVPQPLATLAAYKLTRSDGQTLETFDFNELWVHAQCLGRWGAPSGTLVLARMSLPVPEKVPSIHVAQGHHLVTRELFDAWRQEAEAGTEWTAARQHQWLETFLGAKFLAEPEPMRKGGPGKATTVLFRQPEGATPRRWVFLVVPAADPQNRLVLAYEAAAKGQLADKGERGVLQSLATLEFYRPTREESAAGGAASVRKETPREDWTPEYVASREQIVRSIENLKGWWCQPTDNFILVANLDNRKTIRVIEENLEDCRRVFTGFYPIKRPLTAVSVCRLFKERPEYQAYVGKEFEWSGGLWDSRRKELVISPMDWGNVRQQREMLVNVVFHESFHQYIFYVTGERHTPIWFNEGNATFFEGIEFKGKGRYEILPTYRQKEIVDLAKRGFPSVSSLLKMDHKQFIGGNRSQNYAMVWALTYFLRKGCPVIKKQAEYGEILSRYYDAVLATGDPEKATEMAWAGIDLEQFDADFAAFWERPLDIKKAARAAPVGYVPAPAAADAVGP